MLRMRKVLGVRNEPLVHFLITSAAVFALYGLVGRNASGASRRIEVSPDQIAALEAGHRRTWQRPPTAAELDGLIEDYVRTEILAREAIAMGLDRDDTIIRRHLRLRLEAAAEEAGKIEPTDADLRAYLAQHVDRFRAQTRYSFKQVYLNPDRRGTRLSSDVARTLAILNDGGDPAMPGIGDGALLDAEYRGLTTSEAGTLFGESFAKTLLTLPVGAWRGPITSGYGVHLVLVTERSGEGIPAFEDVRAAVHREWTAAQVRDARERFHEALRRQYVVTLQN
jgi:PPIC-type PPIASE domain